MDEFCGNYKLNILNLKNKCSLRDFLHFRLLHICQCRLHEFV